MQEWGTPVVVVVVVSDLLCEHLLLCVETWCMKTPRCEDLVGDLAGEEVTN